MSVKQSALCVIAGLLLAFCSAPRADAQVGLDQLLQSGASAGQAVVWSSLSGAWQPGNVLSGLTGDVLASGAGSAAATVIGVRGKPVAAGTGPAYVWMWQGSEWGLAYGGSWQHPCRACSAANVASLSGAATIDGVSLALGDHVLLTAQTTASQNGPWVVASGAWTRPTAYTSGQAYFPGTVVWVAGGASNAGLWYMTGDAAYTVDTTSTAWAKLAAGGSGTVTSVGLAMPSIFTVSGSPVTTSGTLTASLASESAGTVLAGPSSGSAAAPTFRALAAADVAAALPTDTITGLQLSYSSTGTGNVTVAGAGTSAVDGTYEWAAAVGYYAQSGYFLGDVTTSGYIIYWAGSSWQVAAWNGTSPATPAYDSSGGQTQASGPAGPWAVIGGGGGASPAPTVTQAASSYGAVVVSSGSAYVPAASAVVTTTGTLTWQPTSAPTASAFTYIYLTGAGALTESTTAPQAPYQGTARQDASGDRYLGCALVNNSPAIVNFTTDGGGAMSAYRYVGSITAYFAILSGGTATTATNLSTNSLTDGAPLIPPTTTSGRFFVANRAYSTTASTSAFLYTPGVSTASVAAPGAPTGSYAWEYSPATGTVETNATQQVAYAIGSTPTGGSGVTIYVIGFEAAR